MRSEISTQSRLNHIYEKLKNHIRDEATVADIMADIKSLVAANSTERKQKQVDYVSEVYGYDYKSR